MAVPLTSFGFACRVERLDLREKLDAEQTAELVKLFEKPLGYGALASGFFWEKDCWRAGGSLSLYIYII